MKALVESNTKKSGIPGHLPPTGILLHHRLMTLLKKWTLSMDLEIILLFLRKKIILWYLRRKLLSSSLMQCLDFAKRFFIPILVFFSRDAIQATARFLKQNSFCLELNLKCGHNYSVAISECPWKRIGWDFKLLRHFFCCNLWVETKIDIKTQNKHTDA